MKNVSGDSICIAEEDLEPSSSVLCIDKCNEKDDEEIGMGNNLVTYAEEESVKLAFEVNCEIAAEEHELRKTSEDSPTENVDESDEETYLIKKGGKAGIINSEDENFEDSSRSNKENIQESYHNKKITNKSSTFKKKSKNQIKEERLKIQSETHRLMRERHITIPYHLPKQRTLKEFLSRKKNRANIPLNTPSFKMVEIWKDIEESTKTASEFFKSDSDSGSEVDTKEVKSKKFKQKGQKREGKSLAFDNISNRESNDKVEDNADCCSSTDKQDHHVNNDNVEVSTIEQNNIEKEGEKNYVALDMHEENTEVTPCAFVGDTTNEQSNSVKTCENSNNSCIVSEILQSINESNPCDKYTKLKTLEWVKNIPVCEKLLKPNKKEMLLKKINPTLLKITPKLSGESDSVIDLENLVNDVEIGAKKLKKRFFKNCLPPRQVTENKVELTLTMSEADEKGKINNITTEKLIYHSTESFESIKCEKPGAKLQRLREELQKKIEEKWEEEYRRQIMEAQLEACNKEKEISEDEEELLEDLEDENETESLCTESENDESDNYDNEEKEEDEDEDDGDDDDDYDYDYDKPKEKMKKNFFIDNEAEESGCEESGSEGGNALVEDEKEREDSSDGDSENGSDRVAGNKSSGVPKNITSVHTEEIFDKDSNSSNAYDTQSSQIPPYQPGGGMLNGGSELSQYDDDNSFPKSILSPTLKLSMDFLHDRKNTASQESSDFDLELPEVNRNKRSFIPRFPENENFDLNDAYEFCSGKFPDHGEQSRDVTVDSQGPVTSESNEFGLNSEVITVRNTSFGSNASKEDEVRQAEKKMVSRLKRVNDDGEDENEIQDTNVKELEYITGKRITSDDSDNGTEKSFVLKNKKTRKHLHFSDEEENSGSEQESGTPNSDDEALEGDNTGRRDNFSESEVESFEEDSNRKVEYNSEEEEIVNPREFFEKEAELSGSEWSGDEDERDLDRMEEEVGDGDKLDDKKVRSQLEKIHMRTLLDDDARQVRLLQELLFEDGDLFDDGPKRERNFRWKDLGTFFDEDGNGGDANVSQDQEEAEEDEQSRKQRHEKELFLLNLKSKKEELGFDEDEDERISLLKLGKVVLQNSMKSNVVGEEKVARNSSSVVNNIGFKAPVALSKKRGSFLSRNEEFLSRLAKFTSNATDNILGPKHSKNFVFAAKSPEKINHSGKEDPRPKRKDVSPKSDNHTKKRLKLHKDITHQQASVLDRLV